ncbi:hypothetical protein GCM10007086_18620 [Photobacterium aphoticum]|nr:hypothetical protein GCM10007086_18620 [Photobacterium aphoticum]
MLTINPLLSATHHGKNASEQMNSSPNSARTFVISDKNRIKNLKLELNHLLRTKKPQNVRHSKRVDTGHII